MSTSAPIRTLPRTGAGVLPAREGVVRVAAIDIGSNSVRQIVADVSADGTIRVVDEMKAAPRLGAGLSASGDLDPAAVDRAVEAITRMHTLAGQLGASRIEAVATSAVREASNGSAFIARVREATGLRIRVLSGQQEARLTFRSALAHFELGAGRAVVLDIGGGSLEVALSADGLVESLESLPLGAIRMTEAFLTGDAGRKQVAALRKAVRKTLRGQLPYREWRGAQVIGSGGTFTNLAGMHLARQGVATARTTHGTTIARAELEHVLEWLQDMPASERATVPGLNPARADIIVAGLAVAAETMARFEARELVVSAYGIREGLLLETARVSPAVVDPGVARERSVREFAERSHYEEHHARQVQRLALQLFDTLGPRLGCEPGDRVILADAALLHDVGYHISYNKHHKHSYHLILHADFLGMNPEEQVAIANIARYHRGPRPKKKHRNFGGLDGAIRDRIERLAAILRVADGFDRGHVGTVEKIKVRWLDRALRLTPVPTSHTHSLRLELWGASRKSDLLARVAGLPVEVVNPDGSVVPIDLENTESD
jgi:exopolyphosphatase/guanosine-5'-triphosphate,3'-diphosphate pyrophosphatase